MKKLLRKIIGALGLRREANWERWMIDDPAGAVVPVTMGRLVPVQSFYDAAKKALQEKNMECFWPADGQALILPPGARIEGDLHLNWNYRWIHHNRIAVIWCEGDLELTGDLVNPGNMPYAFYVMGDLRTKNIYKRDMHLVVAGDAVVSGIFIADYNDGSVQVQGRVQAEAIFVYDHDFRCDDIKGHYIDYESDMFFERYAEELGAADIEEILAQLFVDEVVEDGMLIEAEALFARYKQGLPIFRDQE